MKISVFGATGMAGSAIVTEALDRGHPTLALARRPVGLSPHERLAVRSLDLTGPADLGPALAGSDAAVLTIRLAPGQEHLLAPTTSRFLDAAATTGTRVIVVGGAPGLRSPRLAGQLLIDDPVYVPTPWQAVARASLAQLEACRDHRFQDWTYLSPPAVLEPGRRSGTYRRGTDTLLVDVDGASRISAADLAIAIVDELESPAGPRHFTVVQAA